MNNIKFKDSFVWGVIHEIFLGYAGTIIFPFLSMSVNINDAPLFPAYVLNFNYCSLTDSYTFSITNIKNNIRNLISGVQGKK
jgi:hypothetical protein